jgi:putative transposase
LRGNYPHHVWAIDLQIDQTMDRRTLKVLNVLDEYSRVCLAIRVGRYCKAVDVINTIEELLKLYVAPTHLRMVNGPEFIANALQGGAPTAETAVAQDTSRQDRAGRIHSWSRSMDD